MLVYFSNLILFFSYHVGGGFNTNSALSVVRKKGLSAAIFAPGWVYEQHDATEYRTLNAKFWLKLFPYLSVKGPDSFPIQTSFCSGYGYCKYRCGQVNNLPVSVRLRWRVRKFHLIY